jgi:hypothetical protein
MHDDAKANDPLLQAIAELREDLDRLIDEQGAIPAGAVADGSSPPSPTVRADAGAEPPVATASAPEPAPRRRRAEAGAAPERASEPPRPEPEPAADGRAPDDSWLRLDALAKHLDRKMRQASTPAADPPGRPSA